MRELVPPLWTVTAVGSCVRSSMRFLNLWLRTALEWTLDVKNWGKIAILRYPSHSIATLSNEMDVERQKLK